MREPGQHGLGRIVGGRDHLEGAERTTVLTEEDEIGEGAADVDTDTHEVNIAQRVRRHQHCFVLSCSSVVKTKCRQIGKY